MLFRSLPQNRRLEWASNIVGGNLLNLAEISANLGGHLAPGIGDYAYRELGSPRNDEVVRIAVERVRRAGREIASPDETREMLGL